MPFFISWCGKAMNGMDGIKSSHQKGVTMTEKQAIDKVIDIALAEEGYLEKASNKKLYDKTANPGSVNYTKYGKEMHEIQPVTMDFPAPWCDAFVDWCFYKAFGADLARKILCGDFDDYTVNSAGYYKNAGRWTGVPARGHQIFLKNSGGICHTGLVYKVSGSIVYTIEGNASDSVAKRSYSIYASNIAGYGMPRYDLAADEAPAPTPTPNPDYTIGDCNVALPMMIKGVKCPAVKSLQILLNAKGYKGTDRKPLDVDGDYGKNTAYAVEKFQKDCGMHDINFGTVASLTWTALIRG